jgi:hypothetical protein
MDPPADELRKEAKRIEEDTRITAKAHFASAHFWSALHWWLGVPSALLAAGAGGMALWDFGRHYAAAALLSLLVMMLTALSTLVNATERASSHLKAGNRYNALADRARRLHRIDCGGHCGARQDLEDLAKEQHTANADSPQPSMWAYRHARQGIEEGEAQHRVDMGRTTR